MSYFCIHGLGLAGSTVAWQLWQRGIPFSIIDHGQGGSSRVAAGLIQPITGKNATLTWEYDVFFKEAENFYRGIEITVAQKFWYPLESIRLVPPHAEKKLLPKLLATSHAPYVIGEIDSPWTGMRAIAIRGSARLDVAAFVNATREFFAEKGYLIPPFSPQENDTTPILCEGAEGLMLHHPQVWPHRCAKGEILTVHAPSWQQTRLISGGAWLVPIGNDCYKIGATYEWHEVDEVITAEGFAWLTRAAQNLGGADFTILDHQAGIRPIVRKSMPIIGKIPQSNHIVFNGLGSKGSLYAPGCAKQLIDFLIHDSPIQPELDAAKYFSV